MMMLKKPLLDFQSALADLSFETTALVGGRRNTLFVSKQKRLTFFSVDHQSALADLSFEPTALAVGGPGIFFPRKINRS